MRLLSTIMGLLLIAGCHSEPEMPDMATADLAKRPGEVCLYPSKSDPCLGASECDDDNKDCSPTYCSTGGGRFGVCVNRHCYWWDPSTDPAANPGEASCFVPPKGDECVASFDCDDDNKDCSPGLCHFSGGKFGVCLARKCYWFGQS